MKKAGRIVNVFKKKGSRNYYFQIVINGRRIVESTRESDRQEALKKAEERCMELKLNVDFFFYLKKVIKLVNEMEPKERDEALKTAISELNGEFVKRVTLDEAFDLFKTKPRKRSVSQDTCNAYRNLWMKFVGFVNMNFPNVKYLSEINKNIAEKFLYSESKKGIAERTYNERITKFRTIFSALSEDAGLRKNVWQSVDKMREGHISKRPFSKSQIDTIFQNAAGAMRTLCMIGLYTGLRLGDAATLKWEEVDFEKSLITRLPNKTKNLRKNVEIPLLGGLRKELERVKTGQSRRETYILPDFARQYLKNPARVSTAVQTFFEKAGIETKVRREGVARQCAVFGFHSFRHSFVSICAANGIPMNVVMELVGHRSVMVHEIYQHASSEQKIKAINVIENEFHSKNKRHQAE